MLKLSIPYDALLKILNLIYVTSFSQLSERDCENVSINTTEAKLAHVVANILATPK